MALTQKRIEVEQLKSRRQFMDQQEMSKHQVTIEALKARLSQLEGLKQQQQTLSLVAPISGRITDRAEALHVGRWINKRFGRFAYVVDQREKRCMRSRQKPTSAISAQASRPDSFPTAPSVRA
ncbi:MAG: hypothetical protein HC938_17195 [Nitrospira sp.]|nr:hypothetical protein [Nitrospira sp.]